MTNTNQNQPAINQGDKAKNHSKRQSAQGCKTIPYFVSDKPGKYRATRALTETQIIKAALALSVKAVNGREPMTSPWVSQLFLESKLKGYEREVFAVLFLDNQNRVIAFEELFVGTIDSATVHPREVVKRALQLNAAAVIFAHNHPSGNAEPSTADKHITNRLKETLGLVDIRVLDHFIIGDHSFSFAEHGLI